MSAGQFTRSRYEADSGEIHPIRVQPETITATLGGNANSAPAGAVTVGLSAQVSQSRRALGLTARKVTLAWTSAVPDGYDPRGTIRIPILTRTAFDDIQVGDTGTYLATDVTVVGKSPESAR